MIITKYSQEYKSQWDVFLDSAKNGHFMFKRDYMEYHSDRFIDASVLIFDDKNVLCAIFPANIVGDVIHSHQGLTFGGVIINLDMTASKMLNVFDALLEYYHKLGVKTIFYKRIPYIYNVYPSEEDKYALFRNGAKIYRMDACAVISYNNMLSLDEKCIRDIQKAKNRYITDVVTFEETNHYTAFYNILHNNLFDNYGIKPVHNLQEIELLSNKFPENIKLFCIRNNSDLLVGSWVFITKNVCHTQYTHGSQEGKRRGFVDLMNYNIIQQYKSTHKYFSFGTSNENNGLILNENLMSFKEKFGARTVAHEFFQIDL